jgi:hypothetical protein
LPKQLSATLHTANNPFSLIYTFSATLSGQLQYVSSEILEATLGAINARVPGACYISHSKEAPWKNEIEPIFLFVTKTRK